MKELQKFQDDLCVWSESTFGLGDRILGMIAHLKKEVNELEIYPSDITEMADCFILILNIAGSQRISVDDLFTAAKNKMEINKKRKWTKHNADGSIEHGK